MFVTLCVFGERMFAPGVCVSVHVHVCACVCMCVQKEIKQNHQTRVRHGSLDRFEPARQKESERENEEEDGSRGFESKGSPLLSVFHFSHPVISLCTRSKLRRIMRDEDLLIWVSHSLHTCRNVQCVDFCNFSSFCTQTMWTCDTYFQPTDTTSIPYLVCSH